MHRVLVTGGLGFIGSNLIKLLIEQKYTVINIDKITYSIPLGIIGQLAHSIWVKAELNRIFNYRYDIIEKIFKI